MFFLCMNWLLFSIYLYLNGIFCSTLSLSFSLVIFFNRSKPDRLLYRVIRLVIYYLIVMLAVVCHWVYFLNIFLVLFGKEKWNFISSFPQWLMTGYLLANAASTRDFRFISIAHARRSCRTFPFLAFNLIFYFVVVVILLKWRWVLDEFSVGFNNHCLIFIFEYKMWIRRTFKMSTITADRCYCWSWNMFWSRTST